DPGPRRQRGDLHRRARRVGRREVAAVHPVQGGEVGEIDNVDGRLHDVAKPESRGREHRREVLAHARGLRLDPAGDELPGGWVDANLARAEHEVAGGDGLRVRPERTRRALARDPLVAHVRTRATFMTPRTRPRFRITRFSSSALPTMSSKTFCAFRSPSACTCARVMLMPAELIAFDMAARRPGRSTQVTSTRTARGVPFPFSHWTSIRRCGSLSSTFGQSSACTVTPRPRVMKPVMRSPGSGLDRRSV